MGFKSLRWGSVAALACGLGLRWWFIWRYASISDDALMYGNIAQSLLKHGVYGISHVTDGVETVQATLIRLPGYPLFLAACFAIFGAGRYSAVLWVQVILDLWTCLLLAATSRRVAGDRAGMAALWLGAACPFMATYCAAPLTEVATLWTIALAIYSMVRWRQAGGGLNWWLSAVGFALAFSILLRPDEGLLAAAVVPGVIWFEVGGVAYGARRGGQKRRHAWSLRILAPALVVSILALLPLVPWTARNWHTFHVIQPLAPKNANDPGTNVPYGFERWYRTWAIEYASTEEVYWKYDGDTIAISDLPTRAFDSQAQYAETDAILRRYNETTSWTPEMDAEFARMAADRVKADPLRYYLVLPAARLLNMVLRPRADLLPWPIDWWNFPQHPEASTGMSAFALLNLAYFGLAVIGFSRRAQWPAKWAPLLWTIGFYVALRSVLLLTLDNSEPRYTLEFYPVLILFGAPVLAGLYTRVRRPGRTGLD